MSAAVVIACPECDLLQTEPSLPARGRVRCARCGALLYRTAAGGLERALAYAATAAVLFLIANGAPIAGLATEGDRTSTTLFGTTLALRAQSATGVAALVLATGLLMPALDLGLTLYLVVVLRLGARRRGFPLVLRLLHAAQPWSLIDVLVLGALVAIGRLAQLARVEIGAGLWAFGGLMLMMAAIPTGFDIRQVAVRFTRPPVATGTP